MSNITVSYWLLKDCHNFLKHYVSVMGGSLLTSVVGHIVIEPYQS